MKSPARVVSFFIVNALFNLASSFAHPVTPTVIQDLHLPDYMFGLALAVMMTTMFLFSPFWGNGDGPPAAQNRPAGREKKFWHKFCCCIFV